MNPFRTFALAVFSVFLVGLLLLELMGPIPPATLRVARQSRMSLVRRAVPLVVAPRPVAFLSR